MEPSRRSRSRSSCGRCWPRRAAPARHHGWALCEVRLVQCSLLCNSPELTGDFVCPLRAVLYLQVRPTVWAEGGRRSPPSPRPSGRLWASCVSSWLVNVEKEHKSTLPRPWRPLRGPERHPAVPDDRTRHLLHWVRVRRARLAFPAGLRGSRSLTYATCREW